MARFHRICHAEEIEVLYSPRTLTGRHFRSPSADRSVIVLSSALPPDRLEFTAFHELGHHFFQGASETAVDLFAALSLGRPEVGFSG